MTPSLGDDPPLPKPPGGGQTGAPGLSGCPASRPALPPHRRIAAELLERIADGSYTGRLPSGDALAREFRVNRKTAYKAIHDLADCGAAQIVPGLGAFVVPPRTDDRCSGPGYSPRRREARPRGSPAAAVSRHSPCSRGARRRPS